MRETAGDTEDLFAGRWNILALTDQLTCKDLISLLDEFANAMEGFIKPPPSGEVAPVVSTMLSLAASRLLLNIDGQSLVKLTETDPGISELRNVEYVSLAEGLLNNDTELDIDSKTCLAVVLSHSLLDFCWESWFPVGW